MKVKTHYLAGASLLLLVSACTGQDLTRGKAENILDQVGAQPSISHITVSYDQIMQITHIDKASVEQLPKLLTFNGSKPCLTDSSDIRLATGQFSLCQGYVPPGVTWQHPGGVATLTKPIGWSVSEITGISDGPSPKEKLIEYTWRYDLSEYPKQFASIVNPTPPAQGKALLRLYDDGWRFVEFK